MLNERFCHRLPQNAALHAHWLVTEKSPANRNPVGLQVYPLLGPSGFKNQNGDESDVIQSMQSRVYDITEVTPIFHTETALCSKTSTKEEDRERTSSAPIGGLMRLNETKMSAVTIDCKTTVISTLNFRHLLIISKRDVNLSRT